MESEEAELLPAGIVSCLINNMEVRILKISPRRITLRIHDDIEKVSTIKVVFYMFQEYRYKELVVKDYKLVEKKKEEFYNIYIFTIKDEEYLKNVRCIVKDYTKYVMLKNFGQDNEFSKEMVGYPAEKDYEFYSFYNEQKRDWLLELDDECWCVNNIDSIELALTLNNDILYKTYMDKDILSFKEYYFKENFINNHKLAEKNISRIYIGNEFCHNLFPETKLLMKMLEKAKTEKLNITLCFTYMRDCYIEKTKDILNKVYNWCVENNKSVEIIINDWGMLKLIEDKIKYLKASLGTLLNKRKKDPRYSYKKGYIENKELISKNSLNSVSFYNVLKKYNIERYEYENCGYIMSIAGNHNSLHIPFYITNTSQYCPLYAMCTNMDRGSQKLVKECPKYCSEYIFAYPKHLKMVGRYNSLFAFDDTIFKDSSVLENYISNGIERIVLNFI